MADFKTALVWFRQDLRLRDNAALLHAAGQDYKIIPVYILDDKNAGEWKMGGASRWWLHKSLGALNEDLQSHLVFRRGAAEKIIPELIKQTGAQAVFWNRCYEPWRIARDKIIKKNLKDSGIESETFKDFLLWEPWEVLKDDGTPYKVFTPYYRNGCLRAPTPPASKKSLRVQYADFKNRGRAEDLSLLPSIPWHAQLKPHWQPGEKGARKSFQKFLESGLKNYRQGRNIPALENVSRLSPHLHFGEISIREVWHEVRTAGIAQGLESDTDHFCSELGWREFSTYLLYHFPALPRTPLNRKFEKFPWDKNDKALQRWQKGLTGIPIIDAGMRQLWQTGWMHNRVRMIVASFLVKNLRIHWHEGEDWFWDCLVDADLANNSASWQWVAGCGADAAPYFRIFNPVTQGEKFDPAGEYVRRYVPELKNVPGKYIHRPWETSVPGYPEPLVDLSESRKAALEAFSHIKTG
ncbi:MAG: deoxyribodipyrimidine photo-lyase [Alphaproteobacteria bacterium]|nr:deoxyribodipyrimidine photo-lyase [Alphaproteobacteria bacterium]